MRIKSCFIVVLLVLTLSAGSVFSPFTLIPTSGPAQPHNQFVQASEQIAFLHDGSNATNWFLVSCEGVDNIISTGGYLRIRDDYDVGDPTDKFVFNLTAPITDLTNLRLRFSQYSSVTGLYVAYKFRIFNDKEDLSTDAVTWDMTQTTDETVEDFAIDDYDSLVGAGISNVSAIMIQIRLSSSEVYAYFNYIELYYNNPEWDYVGSNNLYFNVPISESALWALNSWYIIAGLVMLPTGTMVLAITARDKTRRNMTNVFYGILLLFLGLGLVIGSVMP